MLNLEGRIGGDATLSHRGEEYALKLPELVRESVGVSAPFTPWLRAPSRDFTPGLLGFTCRVLCRFPA
jgi:hypothetical protein